MLRRLGMPEHVLSLFDMMSEAELLITQAKQRWPEREALLHGSFKLLCPTDPLRDKVVDVYRVHVNELLERVVSGADTRPATLAEVLCATLDGSLKAPFNSAYGAFAEVLFQKVMPGRLDMVPAHEQWPQQHAEFLHEARRTLAVSTRVA